MLMTQRLQLPPHVPRQSRKQARLMAVLVPRRAMCQKPTSRPLPLMDLKYHLLLAFLLSKHSRSQQAHHLRVCRSLVSLRQSLHLHLNLKKTEALLEEKVRMQRPQRRKKSTMVSLRSRDAKINWKMTQSSKSSSWWCAWRFLWSI